MRSHSAWQERAAVLANEIVSIADRASSKDEIAAAKLKIEARQWVVEKYLLKELADPDRTAESAPITVTINASSDTA